MKVSGVNTSICLEVLKVSSLQEAFYTKPFLRDGICEGGSSEAGLPARCLGREQASTLPEEVNYQRFVTRPFLLPGTSACP